MLRPRNARPTWFVTGVEAYLRDDGYGLDGDTKGRARSSGVGEPRTDEVRGGGGVFSDNDELDDD